MKTITEQLNRFDIRQNVPLSELTSFRIGGDAAFVWQVDDYVHLSEIITLCRDMQLRYVLLGKGTNVLAEDAGYPGLVIRFDRPLHSPVYDGCTIRACAGMSLTQLAKETVANGLQGMECLSGIPGTVGGACAMNAGAYGAEIRQILQRVRVLRDGQDQWVDVKPEMLGYRTSVFSFPNCIVLEAELRLLPDDGGALDRMKDCTQKRKEKQPLEYPSAGSVFKRPTGYFAGALIQESGCKGLTVGGAQVSEKHAGFIVNRGGATEQDVSELIAVDQARVREHTGVSLECEIKRLGDLQCIY